MNRQIPHVGVVILTKDRPDLMRNLSAALYKQKDVELKVYVLDNGEDDDETWKICDAYNWVCYQGPIESYSDGCNRGAAQALNDDPALDALFMLNNDVKLGSAFTIREMYDATAHVGIVGVRALNSDGTINFDGTSFHNGIPFHMGRNSEPQEMPNTKVPAVTFACAMIRPYIWQHLNGLDEEYWFGFEDTDFCLRARLFGYSIGIVRSVSVVHNEKTTRTGEEDDRNLAIHLKNWYTRLREVNFNDVGETFD